MITVIELERGKLSTMYTLVGEMYPRSQQEPGGYTHIRVLQNGKVRGVNGELFGDDTPTTPSPSAKRKPDLHFSMGNRNYTIGHLTDSSVSGLSLQYTTPLNLKPGLYELESEDIKKEIKNARMRSRNAIKVIGVVPGTWKQSDEELFFDYENNVLSYRLIVVSKLIGDLRKKVKEYGKQQNIHSLRSPSKPTPRRLFD
jgi:hypothetical protein